MGRGESCISKAVEKERATATTVNSVMASDVRTLSRSLVVRDHPSDKKGVDVKVVRPGGGVELWTMLGQQQEEQQQEGQSRPGR